MNQRNFTGYYFGKKAEDFKSPTQVPASEAERRKWQEANRSWWSATPFRYDWREEIPYPLHSQEYFEEIDRRFFESSRPYMPYRELPFEREIPFQNLSNLDILEIGVGQGSHAGLIAPRAKSFTGIDLTNPAVESTRKRMQLLGVKTARVMEMDAEEMTFPDASFDYIWTWGVIHHSADTRRIVEQMHRVLRPGGKVNVMVYHRSFWKYYVFDGVFKRMTLRGRGSRSRSLHDANQAATDGALARYYRPVEWRQMVGELFTVDEFRIYGLKNDMIPLPAGRIKSAIEGILPDALTRTFTNRLGWGSFLTVHMTKK
jgi:SAM-dependent methyltransferase